MNNSTEGERWIDDAPKMIVFMLFSPDYLVLVAYSILVWQLLSLYFDGHAFLFTSPFQGKGPFIVSTLTLLLLLTQTLLVILYVNNSLAASFFSS